MTTQQFLSENRNQVISFYNSNIKGECDITLKDFMLKLMKDFKHIVKVVDLYSVKNLSINLFEIQDSLNIESEIEVIYTKPYKSNPFISESSKRQLPSSMR